MKKLILSFATALSASAVIAPVQAQTYMPIQNVRAGLTDGKAWKMVAADGKNAMVTFTADGKGQIKGPVNLGIKWSVKNQEFCMNMGFMLGTRCFQAVAIKGGYQGYTKGKPSIRFTR